MELVFLYWNKVEKKICFEFLFLRSWVLYNSFGLFGEGNYFLSFCYILEAKEIDLSERMIFICVNDYNWRSIFRRREK